MEVINSQLLSKALNFHGQQLQKLWESEFGENDLSRRNIKDLNFHVYGQRQKNLSFQDRGKRLKFQQFLIKKSNSIFSLDPTSTKHVFQDSTVTEDMYAIMPPFETYTNADKQKRLLFFTKVCNMFIFIKMNTCKNVFFLQNVRVGDLILGTIVSKQQSGMMLKVLCTTGIGATVRYAADINIKVSRIS